MADFNTLTGGSGDDLITGSNGDDLITGLDGHDQLDGGDGNDLIISGRGNDSIIGGSGHDVIISGHSYDTSTKDIGDYYDDYGDVSIDTINITAGAGDDVVITSQLIDGSILSGGDGFDILHLNSKTFQADAQISGFEVWNLAGKYNLTYQISDGSTRNGLPSQVDINWGITASSADLTLSNANLTGLTDKLQLVAVDFLQNKLDASAVTQGEGIIIRRITTTTGSGSTQELTSGSQLDDIYHGADGADHFQGNGGNDIFYGNDGDDIAYYSGNHDDYLIAEVSYGQYSIQDLRNESPEGTDQLHDVNRLVFADRELPLIIKGLTIVGTDDSETLAGGDDADEIDGGGGNDQLIGGFGQDDLRGGSGDDTLSGGDGADRLEGGDGNDLFVGDRGNDIIRGGHGRNQFRTRITGFLIADNKDADTIVDLASGTATSADIGSDRLEDISDVFTGNGDDLLIGSAADNYLFASEGEDTIQGMAGNDTLMGAQGSDQLDGGEGDDEAIYTGARNDYEINADASTKKITIKDKRTFHDGTDIVTGIEFFKFADIAFTLSDLMGNSHVSTQKSMDLNGDGVVNQFDSMLMMHYMLGTFPGESIKRDIPGTIDLEAVRTKLNQVFSETFSLGGGLKLDIDGDHRISAFSDGLSIMHYIHQQQHQSISPWAPPSFIQTGRPANEIQQHLKDLVGF